MLAAVKKDIDGKVYEISQFLTTRSLEVMEQLGNILGGPLGKAMGFAFGEKITEDKEVETSSIVDEANLIGNVVTELFKNFKEHKALALIKTLSSENILCDGQPINFDMHYQARIGHLGKVVVAVLEVNYADFLGEMADVAGSGLAEKILTRSRPQPTSTGLSGVQ